MKAHEVCPSELGPRLAGASIGGQGEPPALHPAPLSSKTYFRAQQLMATN
jgi:hypothetical protein